MRTLVLLTCILMALRISAAKKPANPDPAAIFDFTDLDVPKEEEKKARETVEKDDLKADALLPENVRQMLDRLTMFEVIENEILERRIMPARTALKEKLLTLSDKASGQDKLDLVALGKYIEGMAAAEVLQPEKITLSEESGEDSGGWLYKGKPWRTLRPNGTVNVGRGAIWSWLNKNHTMFILGYPGDGHANVVFLSSPQALEASGVNNLGVRYHLTRKTAADGTVRKPSANGLRLVAEAAKSEAALRAGAQNEIVKRRARVAEWLIHEAKAATPAFAARILAEAGRLNAITGPHEMEQQPGRFAGVWLLDNGSRLEFKPGGNIVYSRLGRATWRVSKAHNWGTALILFGNPADPVDAWIARVSTSEPGVLRLYTRDKVIAAKLEQP